MRRFGVFIVVMSAAVALLVGGQAWADYADAVSADNPMGYWRLNETTGDTAANAGTAGGDLDGTYNFGGQGVPGPDQLADGRPLLGFDAGNVAYEVGPDESYMSVDDSPLSNMAEFTMSGWVKPDPTGASRTGLWGQNDAVEFGFIDPDTVQLWTPASGALNYDFDPNTEIVTDAWYHIAAVANGNKEQIYVNGDVVAETGRGGYGSSTFNFNIGGGGIYDGTGNQFDGALDEIAIYDVALSEDQVQAQYDAAMAANGDYPAAVLADNPIGYWRLNETTGDTAANLGTSGAALNGMYNAGEQGAPGPDAPGLGANNVAYLAGPDESFVGVDASPLSNLTEFTFSGWVQSAVPQANRTGLWGQNDAMEFGFIDADTIQMWTPGGGALNYDIFNDPDIGDMIDNGEWFHLVAVGTGEEIQLYINGEQVEFGGSPIGDGGIDDYGASDFPFNAGGGGVYDATGNQLTGVVDEVAIWDVALTGGQIRAQFEAALAPGECVLEAGDADEDLDFDQFDLVKVQVSGLYLTGQPASWGAGDWNGAPGGSQGSPPPGDGVFDQLDIIAALNADVYLKGKYCEADGLAAIAPIREFDDGIDDEQASIVYDANTGEVAVNAPASTNLTSVNIDSATGIFVNHADAQNLDGSFDTSDADNIFKATFGDSFGSLSFGMIATPRLSEDMVAGDLSVIGSLEGGGGLGDVDLIYIPIPEPSTGLLAVFGMIALIGYARRRR